MPLSATTMRFMPPASSLMSICVAPASRLVLEQFLDDGRWALNDLSRGDLADQRVRQGPYRATKRCIHLRDYRNDARTLELFASRMIRRCFAVP